MPRPAPRRHGSARGCAVSVDALQALRPERLARRACRTVQRVQDVRTDLPPREVKEREKNLTGLDSLLANIRESNNTLEQQGGRLADAWDELQKQSLNPAVRGPLLCKLCAATR